MAPARVYGQHPNTQVCGCTHGARNRVGDVVVLEVQKDAVSLLDHSSDDRRPLRREQLTSDLEATDQVVELVA